MNQTEARLDALETAHHLTASDPLLSLRQSLDDLSSSSYSSAVAHGSEALARTSSSSFICDGSNRHSASSLSRAGKSSYSSFDLSSYSLNKALGSLAFSSNCQSIIDVRAPKKLHQCPHCSYQSPKRQHLEYHIRKHTGEKPHACPHCSYRAAHESNMRRHIAVHHRAVSPGPATPLQAFQTSSEEGAPLGPTSAGSAPPLPT